MPFPAATIAFGIVYAKWRSAMTAGAIAMSVWDPTSTSRMPRAVPYRIKSTDGVRLTPLAKMQDLTRLQLYTSQEDKRLNDSYAEIEGLEAVRMVVKDIGVDGLLFQNQGQSWVVVKMDKIRWVLARRES